MKTMGFVISHKENEKRRAVTPKSLEKIKYPSQLYIEEGYGNVLGFSDADYSKYECNIVSRKDAMCCDIVCDPKIGDADYLDELPANTTIFGWVHAVQNRDITDKLIDNSLSAYAWEDMFASGRHCYWRNNELAGEAAVIHAYECFGVMPYNTRAAVLGRGNTACGAVKMLTMLGASIMQYDRRTEGLFREELPEFDVIVNCILWDTNRKDHIIYESDLDRMKKNALIIDISCDRCGGIETSIPTAIEDPIYFKKGIAHYVVDHTPSIFYKTTSEEISEASAEYINMLVDNSDNETLKNAKIFENGIILDNRINEFQGR